MSEPAASTVYLHDHHGRLARIAWSPTPEQAKAVVDEAEPHIVQARVVWPDGSSRVLCRSAIGGPWVAGPRVAAATKTDDERKSA